MVSRVFPGLEAAWFAVRHVPRHITARHPWLSERFKLLNAADDIAAINDIVHIRNIA
jgi:hypothetical protein